MIFLIGLRSDGLGRIVSRAAGIFELEVDHIIFKGRKEGLETWWRGEESSPDKTIFS